jgi:hypothetical protein
MVRVKLGVCGFWVVLALLALVATGWAQETYWTGDYNEDWNYEDFSGGEGEPVIYEMNWNNGIPDSGTDAYILSGSNDPVISSDAWANNLYLNKTLWIESSLAVSNLMVVGRDGTGTVDQGWSNLTAHTLIIGDREGGSGTGEFTQINGNNTFENLVLGFHGSDLGNGTYNLNVAGVLDINGDHLMVGDEGRGYFNHNWGYISLNNNAQLIIGNQYQGFYNHEVGGVYSLGGVILGQSAGSYGSYNMITGFPEGTQLYVGTDRLGTQYTHKPLIVGDEGEGVFQQNGGLVDVFAKLSLGQGEHGEGHYTMGDSFDDAGVYHSAELNTWGCYVGEKGKGVLNQKAGFLSTYGMTLGKDAGSSGVFNQKTDIKPDGDAPVAEVYGTMVVGDAGVGQFYQDGGSLQVTDKLILGAQCGSSGTIIQELQNPGSITVGGGGSPDAGLLKVGGDGYGEYQMWGGRLEVDQLAIGTGSGTGKMMIYGSTASVTIKKDITIGENGQFSAGPGATIHMTGSNFYNYSQDSGNVNMRDLTMIFEGGPEVIDTFEVGGPNFLLGTLQIGGTEGTGYVQLVDLFDNDNDDAVGDEALYVATLILELGSTLDLNGLDFFAGSIIDNGGNIIDSQVPLPASVLLLGTGLVGLLALGGRRRRQRD